MVLYYPVDCKCLETLGKGYLWQRPPVRPGCSSRRVVGHGYVQRYFDGFAEPLWVKRYRCRECGSVHTMRPRRYWRKFLAPVAAVVAALKGKIENNRSQRRVESVVAVDCYEGQTNLINALESHCPERSVIDRRDVIEHFRISRRNKVVMQSSGR